MRTSPHGDGPLRQRPGWAELPEELIAHTWRCSGIECRILVDPRTHDERVAASRLCDQTIVQVGLVLDGHASLSQRLTVRTRDGITVSRWRRSFGGVVQTFAGVPAVDALRPLAEAHAAEVRARRDEMGKT